MRRRIVGTRRTLQGTSLQRFSSSRDSVPSLGLGHLEGQSHPLQHQRPEEIRCQFELRSSWSSVQHRAGSWARMTAQMSLVSRARLSKYQRLPTVEFGRRRRRVVLPAVLPLTWFGALRRKRRSRAHAQLFPCWSCDETASVEHVWSLTKAPRHPGGSTADNSRNHSSRQ